MARNLSWLPIESLILWKTKVTQSDFSLTKIYFLN